MRYLTFDTADAAGAQLLDSGVYRLPLPPRLAGRDRAFAYFTRLGATQSIQWVDAPTIDGDPTDRGREAQQEVSMRNL